MRAEIVNGPKYFYAFYLRDLYFYPKREKSKNDMQFPVVQLNMFSWPVQMPDIPGTKDQAPDAETFNLDI